MPDIDNLAIGSTAQGDYGAAKPEVTLAEAALGSVWNVQGESTRSSFMAKALQLFDVSLQIAPNTAARCEMLTVLWLGPRSWLMIDGQHQTLTDFSVKRDALNGVGGALFDVSASRIAWTVAGTNAARMLEKTCPLDLHPRSFPVGSCAQSMLGHINALVYKYDAMPTFVVMVARSFAADTWQTLCVSAAAGGYRVAPPSAFPRR